MPITSCGADTLANSLFASLTAGVDFTLPAVDLSDPDFTIPASDFDPPVALTNADLTTGVPGTGTGTFDIVMKSVKEHLRAEYDANRITGAEYAKAYVELVQAALGNSVQFLLGRDQAYWNAVAAQLQARIAEAGVVEARVKLEIAKAQLAATVYQASNQQAEYALTKIKLANESIAGCTADYNLTQILPAQKLVLDDQHAQNAYQLANILPEQKFALHEQGEAQRAQTHNTRQDGETVVGVMGKQKDLYTQQITSYQRDAEVKAAKLFTDAWITMKTIDEGLLPPTNFDNTSLNNILADLKTNNSLG